MKRKIPLTVLSILATLGVALSQSEATYSVNYSSTWSQSTHPHPGGTFPPNAHYSKLVGATHNDQVVFLEAGALASPGIKDVAELGNNTVFFSEVNTAITGGDANTLIDGPALGTSTGEIDIADIVTTEDYPLMSLVSMIAPSPDWIIHANSIELLDINGDWVPTISMDLYPYDAGTDSGLDYTSPNQVTNPAQPISGLQGVAPFSNEKMGTLTITLESVLNTGDNDLDGLRIYPNPASNTITIAGYLNAAELEVYNVLGARVVQRKLAAGQSQLDISNLPSGVYMFRLQGTDGSSTVKKVVKR